MRRGDALLAGALSGLTGGGIFALLSFVTIVGITQEQLEQMIESARSLAPFLAEGQAATMAGAQFKAIMVIAIGLFLLAAIAAGALAGLVARRIFRPHGRRPHEQGPRHRQSIFRPRPDRKKMGNDQGRPSARISGNSSTFSPKSRARPRRSPGNCSGTASTC